MLSLDATTKSLEIKLAGAVSTTELPFVASYVDINQSSFAMTGSSESDGTTNGSTAVIVTPAPGATTTRKLNYLSVVNVDTAAVTLTVQVNNAATKRVSFRAVLQVGDQLSFTDASGWVVFDSTGSLKEGFSGILPAANFPALSGDVTTSAGSTVTAIGALKVTNAMLAGSIAASKLIGTDIATVGTVTVGVWNAGAVTTSGVLTVNGGAATVSNLADAAGGLLLSAVTTGRPQIDFQNATTGALIKIRALNTKDLQIFTNSTTLAATIYASGGTDIGNGSTDPGANNLRVAGIINFAGTNTTGAGIAGFGANSPASTLTAPYTWIQVKTADGSTAYIPCWK